MRKDMHNIGYGKFCDDLARLEQIARDNIVLTETDFTTSYREYRRMKGNAVNNLNCDLYEDACRLGRKLLKVLNLTGIIEDEIVDLQNSKEFLYNAFFKDDYEPLVEEMER